MLSIVTIPSPGDPLADHARSLFRHYGDFLRATQSCGTFNFLRYDQETATLPAFYSDHNGEVLLAIDSALDDATPAACIVYRDTAANPRTCEIKRLFVHPDYRGRGLARTLVAEAIARASARGYTHAILDTDIVNMPSALALYHSFGFREYGSRQGNIAFFERTLL